MSTNWQKSCIEALSESTIAFKMFRIEQKNIKMMDQFLDKIWPYKYVAIQKPGEIYRMYNKDKGRFQKRPGKKKRIYKSINIGIEIEYDGCNCQQLEKQLLANGAVSFNSGWDGGGTSGERPGVCLGRLRENRLRINGMKGLKALYILLEWMKNNNCKIAEKSGMHYHVDCTDVLGETQGIWGSEITKIGYAVNDILANLTGHSERAIESVYNQAVQIFYSYIKSQSEFNTIEWRMGTPTLQYKTLVLQILVAIHITECAKYKNKTPNEKYLRILGEISGGQNYLPVKQY